MAAPKILDLAGHPLQVGDRVEDTFDRSSGTVRQIRPAQIPGIDVVDAWMDEGEGWSTYFVAASKHCPDLLRITEGGEADG